MFLANYGDVLTDAPLDEMIEDLRAGDATATFLAARPNYSFHIVRLDDRQSVSNIEDITESEVWINGGYFVFRREIFDHMEPGEELVEEPFRRLIARGGLMARRHDGFWAPMDTLKDKHRLEALMDSGLAPWRVWEAAGIETEAASLS
jgi:glucose-1-phosphate cytidylyltransferase